MAAPVLQLPVKVLRSATAGRRPGDGTFRALTDGEVFINTQDRVLCYLSASGTLLTVPFDPAYFAALAPLTSPAFTGTPTTTAPAASDNSQQVAPTSWVQSLLSGFRSALFGTAAPSMAGTAAAGSAATASRSDHVHPTDASRAPLASPTFSGSMALSPAAGSDANATLNKPASGQRNQLIGTMAGALRWVLSMGDAASEAGSNAGSNWGLTAYSDSGASLGTALSFARSSLQGAFAARPTFAGATPWDSANLPYTPNRTATALASSSGKSGSIAQGSWSPISGFNFTATAQNILVAGKATMNCAAASINCAIYTAVYDNTAGAAAANSDISYQHSAIAGGFFTLVSLDGIAGLTLGRSYTVTLYAQQVDSNNATTYVNSSFVWGIEF